MRTATVTRFGGPDVFEIQERPDPAPGPDQVVVAVEVVPVLFLETVVRTGVAQDYWPMRPPYVPGNAVAGRVVTLGEHVDRGRLGRRVVGRTGNEGGYADRAVVDAAALWDVPDDLDLAVAAAVVQDGATALALFDVMQVGASDTVLVHGASGGLGVLSVRLARARAARVVATARGAKVERLRALAPDAVVDLARPDWVDQVRGVVGPHGADVVLDNIGGDVGAAALDLVARGGRFSAHGAPSGRFASIAEGAGDITVTGIADIQMSPAQRRDYTEQALRAAAAGQLVPAIGQTFRLEDAGAAHAAIQGRDVFGKTLLTIERDQT